MLSSLSSTRLPPPSFLDSTRTRKYLGGDQPRQKGWPKCHFSRLFPFVLPRKGLSKKIPPKCRRRVKQQQQVTIRLRLACLPLVVSVIKCPLQFKKRSLLSAAWYQDKCYSARSCWCDAIDFYFFFQIWPLSFVTKGNIFIVSPNNFSGCGSYRNSIVVLEMDIIYYFRNRKKGGMKRSFLQIKWCKAPVNYKLGLSLLFSLILSLFLLQIATHHKWQREDDKWTLTTITGRPITLQINYPNSIFFSAHRFSALN